MPESWGVASSTDMSPTYVGGTFYEEPIPEIGHPYVVGGEYEDDSENGSGVGLTDDDENRLVRSASVGKRGKAELVTTRPATRVSEIGEIVTASTAGSLRDGTTSSNKATIGSALTADSVLQAYNAASATNPTSTDRRMSGSAEPPSSNSNPNIAYADGDGRQYSRLSAIRRPPRLDMDAVRKAEARGSLTSLPDLIRRATRLAASLERGRRPASQFDDFNLSPGMISRDTKGTGTDTRKSGLSDMLAAFPPPAQPVPSTFRQSIREQLETWPRFYFRGNQSRGEVESEVNDMKGGQQPRKGRRCCGLPLWGFIVAVIVVLILLAAAIVIPIEFLVIRKNNSSSESALAACEKQITCQNGGTNVVSTQGFCSCICRDGFTGFDCSTADDGSCVTANLTVSSTNATTLVDVTLGSSVPRLIEQAEQNYSIALSSSDILAAFSTTNLSCTSENALVTFDGSTDSAEDSSSVTSVTAGVAIVVVTVTPENQATIVISSSTETVAVESTLITASALRKAVSTTSVSTPTVVGDSLVTSTTTITTTVTPTKSTSSTSSSATSSADTGNYGSESSTSSTTASTTSTLTTTSTSTSASATASTFAVTDDVLDFARVVVLYILQEESLANAETAQTALQSFFSSSTSTVDEASNLTLSNGNSVDLVSFQVTVLAG